MEATKFDVINILIKVRIVQNILQKFVLQKDYWYNFSIINFLYIFFDARFFFKLLLLHVNLFILKIIWKVVIIYSSCASSQNPFLLWLPFNLVFLINAKFYSFIFIYSLHQLYCNKGSKFTGTWHYVYCVCSILRILLELFVVNKMLHFFYI